MHKLICFEGINYAGKTSVSTTVAEQIGALYGPRIAKRYVIREKKIHGNLDHLVRFSFFIEEINARSKEILKILSKQDVILDRYLLSILAYHNIIVGERLEELTDLNKINKPDITFLLTVNRRVLRKRMKIRPPKHQYDSDPVFLMRVQKEFLRLIREEIFVVIDTSNRTVEETTNLVTKELHGHGLIA